MININVIPKYLISKILQYLENPESTLIKKFYGYNSSYPMYCFLKYNRKYLPPEIWKYNYNILGGKYLRLYLFGLITTYNLEVYNDYEKYWEIAENIYPSSDDGADSI